LEELKKKIADLEAIVEGQAAQIRHVSEQLPTSKPLQQTTADNP
jgi:hypothetical protein